MEALSKISVMAHGSSRGSTINVTKKTKQYFFWIQFLRQTTPHHVQLRISMKISGIIIVTAHRESNLVL